MANGTGGARPRVVVFEDHTWRGLRPLATSAPVFELRCGLFNTRERAELAGGSGAVLCRRHLAPLLAPGAWPLRAEDGAADELWLNGRLAPDTGLVSALLAAAASGATFAWTDDEGLVAATFAPAAAAAAAQAWHAWAAGGAARFEPPLAALDGATPWAPGLRALTSPATGSREAGSVGAALVAAAGGRPPAWRRVWDLVPATARALTADLAAGLGAGGWSRQPFGLTAIDPGSAPWAGHSLPERRSPGRLPAGVWLLGDDLWCAADVALAPGAVIDARKGPVILDRGCDVAPHTLLEGPLYLGPGCRVKAGARLYGESSFGIGNRLAGEIGESTFGDFTNKQHEGFIGHAVLGAWVNLGALTTCSDLKNNYGSVKVDLGDGLEETGQRFVGLLAGDHVKTAIGTLFNTGTCVGFASNIFGQGMPPKHVPPFAWGGRDGDPRYGLEAALATARVVLGRRGCRLESAHERLFAELAGG
ncbi:hypothetical protein FJ250_00050 [bacterium]|nr:hypothetical protein [bacterium]